MGEGRAGDAYRIIASRSSHVHRNTEGSTQKPNAASACAHPCGTVVVSLSLSLFPSPSLPLFLLYSFFRPGHIASLAPNPIMLVVK